MIKELFIGILKMSLTGAIVILAVLAIRFLLRKMPKIFSYCLWAVVFFRLLCPVSFSAGFSLLGIFQTPQALQSGTELNLEDGGKGPLITHEEIKPVSVDEMHTTPVKNPVADSGSSGVKRVENASAIAANIWIFGIFVMLVYSAVMLLKLKQTLKGSVHEKNNIYITEKIGMPFVIGIFRPRIYLPAALEEKREYVLLHEQIHIRRGDHIVRMVSFLALCLHWFNPFVWLAFFLCGKDMEMSCDEAVVRKLGGGIKKEYSMSLLTMATGQYIANGVPLAFGEGNTGSRIKNILRYKRPTAFAITVVSVGCGIVMACLLANPAVGKSVDDGKNANEILQSAYEFQKTLVIPETVEDEIPEDSVSDKGVVLGQNAEGVYEVDVRSIARSARIVDRYVSLYGDCTNDEGQSLAFAEDCVFQANYSMTGIDYREISFDTFADLIGEKGGKNEFLGKPCLLTFRDNLIVEAKLKSIYVNQGITYDEYTLDKYPSSENLFEKDYYTLASTEYADVSDAEGEETIEVYTTKSEKYYGVNLVMIKAADGRVLHTQDAHTSRAGWNNIYLGETEDGANFLLRVYIEDRDLFGAYGYWVYRLDENGGIRQSAGTIFSFSNMEEYDDELFREWVSGMEYYLKNSHLLLSTQDGELRTEKVSDWDKYNYDTLNLKDRIDEIRAYEKRSAIIDLERVSSFV